MEKLKNYIKKLSIEELVEIYQNEYIPFKKSGILITGKIREITELYYNVTGSYNIDFGVKLFIERCAVMFYDKNKNKNKL